MAPEPVSVAGTKALVGFLPRIRYRDEQQWRYLPPWARYFIDPGARIATCERADSTIVVAASVPTRAYAAALAATGAVLARASADDGVNDADSHFERLCELASEGQEVPVTYRERAKGKVRERHGRLVGLQFFDGELRLKVLVGAEKTGWLRHLINKQQCMNVQLARSAGEIGAVSGVKSDEFLTEALGNVDSVIYSHQTRLDCYILGTVSELRHDTVEMPLGFGSSSHALSTGSFQDILRVKRFLSDSGHYRSEIGSSTREPQGDLNSDEFPLVVFDGAEGFLKWRDCWRGLPWLVLLDRTDLRYREAVELVNTEDMSRVGDANEVDLPISPPGVEISVFAAPR